MSEDIFEFLKQSDTTGGDYFKLQDGDKKSVRILSKPIMGYQLFVDGKPQRWAHDEPRPNHVPEVNERDEKPKKFVAFIVYEYSGQSDAGRVKIWEFTQRTVIDQMAMLFKEEHWTAFELVIARVGKGLDTKYNVTGIKSPIEDTLLEFASKASEYITLTNLYSGENPFIKELPTVDAKPSQADQAANLPF
jgi:hypothetical protein